MRGERVVQNIDIVNDLCETMLDGSLCALGGLTPMPVMSAMEHFPEDFDRKPAVPRLPSDIMRLKRPVMTVHTDIDRATIDRGTPEQVASASR